MGRFIYSHDGPIYKYAFAEEASNLYLLHERYGIGKYKHKDNPTYRIKPKDDLPKLKNLLKELEESYGETFDKAQQEKWKGRNTCSIDIIKEVNERYGITEEHWLLRLVRVITRYVEKNKRFPTIEFDDEYE
jgi:hypothetical protein